MLKRVLLINGLVFSIYMMIGYGTNSRPGFEVLGIMFGLITGVITLLISLLFYYIIKVIVVKIIKLKGAKKYYYECPDCKHKTIDYEARFIIVFNKKPRHCTNCGSEITLNRNLYITISFLFIAVNTVFLHFNFDISGIDTTFFASLYPYANYIFFSLLFVLFITTQSKNN